MEGSEMVFDATSFSVLLQSERLPPSSSSEVLDSLWISNSSAPFHGSSSMVNFENSAGENMTTTADPFFNPIVKEEAGDEDYDRCFHQPEKKRRLSVDQLRFLEKSFEVENKLEPERKVQLAKELNLQPRQVAIWFQNRRARYKTKQLEKDYDSLKSSYDKLKVDCESLQNENEKLKDEVHLLTKKLFEREKGKEGSDSEQSEPNPNSSEPMIQKPNPMKMAQNVSNFTMVMCKQEDANSAKSDVLDSDSPHYTDGNHSSFLEPADSSNAFEPDQSDFSQDEEDNFGRPPRIPKLENWSYVDPSVNSCNLGSPVEDQSFWLWP